MELNSILGGTTKKNGSSRPINSEQSEIDNTYTTEQNQNRLTQTKQSSIQSSPTGSAVNNINSIASSGGMSEIEARVISIIVEKLNVSRSKITPYASFTNLGADSLDTVELIMEFEKAFGINIPDNHAEKIRTVGDAIAYIEANVR